MPILDDVTEQIKDAMRAREKLRVTALRGIRAAFINKMKEDGSDTLTDEACFEVLRRLAKQRKESIEAFTSAGRAEQAAAERAELAIIDGFLPSLADAEQTRAWVQAAIEATGASSARDLGRVMGALMKTHKRDVDGALAREIAAEILGG
jgi:uncharacterized protein YqeY